VNISTRPLFNALLRRPSDQARVVLLVIALVAMVSVLGVTTGSLGLSAAGVSDSASVGEPVALDFSADRVATAADTLIDTTLVALPRTPGPAAWVPDGRPGDLRIDATGDVLPDDYVAAEPAQLIRDLSYGPDDVHRFDLYLPEQSNAPVIVFLHSGGWIGGDRSMVPEMILRFVERGYAVASVDYRLAPDHPFPAPIHDVKRAVRELKVLADDGDLIDGDRMVLYGTSAGGHIAAFVAATEGDFEPTDLTEAQAAHDSSVAGIVVAVGPTDLVQMYDHPNAWARGMSGAHAGCEPCTTAQLELPSVGNYLHGDLPPAYWAYGDEDPLVDAELQGRVMADAWAQASGSEYSWFDLVEGSDHNLTGAVVNQRLIEAFVDQAVDR
jgi:acetyl esterase/lipase